MTPADSLRLVAMLCAYHNRELADETAALWARELERFEFSDGFAAVQLLGTSGRFFPSLADLKAAVRQAWYERINTHPRQLPAETYCSFAEWLREFADAEELAKVAALGPKWVEMVKALSG